MIEGDKIFGNVTLTCDGCGHEDDYETGDQADYKDACNQAKNGGWIITYDQNLREYFHYCSAECKK